MKPERVVGLKIKTFEFFDIIYNEKSIFLEKQNTFRLKSLFQYFIINKDKLCNPSKIISDLWVDNVYSDEKKVLQTYVHRLRNILMKDNALAKDFTANINLTSYKGSYKLTITDVELDTDVFNLVVSQSAGLEEYGEIIKSCDKLLSVYSGHFLQDSSDEYIIVKLQNYYLHTFYNTMADNLLKLENMAKYADIIRICEAIFLIDDLDEKINCIFLRALLETKQIDYLSRHYNYITKKMRDVLDIDPPTEMYNLFQKVKNLYAGVEDENEGSGRKKLDEARVRNIIDEVVTARLDNQKTVYSILKLDLTIRDGAETTIDTAESLKNVMQKALRKRDMYAALNDRTVIAILYEAKPAAYEIIEKRITECFAAEFPGGDFGINISITKAFLIV